MKIIGYLSTLDIISLLIAIIGLIIGSVFTPYLYLFSVIAVFLPGLLRSTGIINDKDEYQLEASKTSGNTAFRIGGILASLFAVGFKTGIITEQHLKMSELWSFFVVFLLLVYMISYATYFWGSSRGARTILIITGLFWTIFILLSGWGNIYALGISLPIAIFVFFGLPFLSTKRPITSGVTLILISLLFIPLLIIRRIRLTHLGSIAIITLLLIPLLISGFILINKSKEEEEVE